MSRICIILFVFLSIDVFAGPPESFELYIDSSGFGNCTSSKWHGSYFLSNMAREYCLYGCTLQVETSKSTIVMNIINHIRQRLPELDSSNFVVESIYRIGSFRDVYYFHIVDEEYWHNRLDVLYNAHSGHIYIIQTITTSELNRLLRDCESYKASDYDLLRYSRLITLLLYPDYPIRFVSSMSEVYMYAVYRPYSVFNLEDSKQNAGVEIGLPSIERDGATVTISFSIMRAEKILRLSIFLDGLIIKSVDEAEIGEFRDWLGIE